MKFDGLLLDGAMGSLLLERSGVFAASEQFNHTHPDLVQSIHRDYLLAGADVIYTNTFGVNPLRYPDDYAARIEQGVSIAIAARDGTKKGAYVALDIGPTGKLLGKAGVSFDEAYQTFAKVVEAARDRTDLVVVETITDLNEMRAAILAVRDHSRLPLAVSMSFEQGGHSAFGCSVESFALTATALGVDAVGLNCSLGPAEMARLFGQLQDNTHLSTFVKPNAGMPQIYKGKSIYNVSPEAFARNVSALRAMGADMVGGCCGTTPQYIATLRRAVAQISPAPKEHVYRGKLCAAAKAVLPTDAAIVGERINPTGKKVLQAALRQGDLDYVVALGPKQEEEGAKLLDVNLGLGGMDDGIYMQEVVERLQSVTNAPLVIDSANPRTIEKGLRYFAGRAMVNSVNGEETSLQTVLPLVKRYGAAVVGLTLDEKGIPDTVEGRVAIAKRILQHTDHWGIRREDVYIDCLTMAEGAKTGSAVTTLESLRQVKRLGCRTILGVSNVSYGMPAREDLNAAFLHLAKTAGLDACIVNPVYNGLRPTAEAVAYLEGKMTAERYIQVAAGFAKRQETEQAVGIDVAVRRGDAAGVRHIISAMIQEGKDAGQALVAALDAVGALYEQGVYFLPQLIAAADAAKAGFDLLYARTDQVRQNKGKLLLATVKGDVHDIGKNIVKAVVSNYGYRVIDLGKDVDAQTILERLSCEMPCVLGLSALMTTTAVNMAEIAYAVRNQYPSLPILVGGAVITQAFAAEIGCTYCKDAAATVRELGKLYA